MPSKVSDAAEKHPMTVDPTSPDPTATCRKREQRRRDALGLHCLKPGLPYSDEFLEFLIDEKRLAIQDSNDQTAIRDAIMQLHDDIAGRKVTV